MKPTPPPQPDEEARRVLENSETQEADHTRKAANTPMSNQRPLLVCPFCQWSTHSKQIMSIHIKVGHSQDEINQAVDDGRIIEEPVFFFTPAPNVRAKTDRTET